MTQLESGKVLVVGDIMMDVLVTMSAEMIRGSDVPSAVETGFGGTASNVASWLGFQKHPVRLLGVVGDDLWGHEIIQNQQEWGVETHVWCNPDLPTGAVVVLNHLDGERSMFPDTRANQTLHRGLFTDEIWEEVSILYISGYTLLNSSTREVAKDIMRVAKSRDIMVVLDPASVGPLQQIEGSELSSWLELCDVILPNELELLALTSEGSTAERLTELSQKVRRVVAKFGAQGCVWVEADSRVEFSALPSQVVDTVGAGDAFAAGLLAALARQDDVETCLSSATKIASLAVSKRGAQPEKS